MALYDVKYNNTTFAITKVGLQGTLSPGGGYTIGSTNNHAVYYNYLGETIIHKWDDQANDVMLIPQDPPEDLDPVKYYIEVNDATKRIRKDEETGKWSVSLENFTPQADHTVYETEDDKPYHASHAFEYDSGEPQLFKELDSTKYTFQLNGKTKIGDDIYKTYRKPDVIGLYADWNGAINEKGDVTEIKFYKEKVDEDSYKLGVPYSNGARVTAGSYVWQCNSEGATSKIPGTDPEWDLIGPEFSKLAIKETRVYTRDIYGIPSKRENTTELYAQDGTTILYSRTLVRHFDADRGYEQNRKSRQALLDKASIDYLYASLIIEFGLADGDAKAKTTLSKHEQYFGEYKGGNRPPLIDSINADTDTWMTAQRKSDLVNILNVEYP